MSEPARNPGFVHAASEETGRRTSGVLLHITSLPGPNGSGDFGPAAYRFVDWLVEAGQRIWQILPLTALGPGNSPYASPSAFAGNPLLIDLVALEQAGWIAPDPGRPDFPASRVDFDSVIPYRMRRLEDAWRGFSAKASAEQRDDFAAFCASHAAWLDDYTLFMVLSERFGTSHWPEWPTAFARRTPDSLDELRQCYAERISFWQFCQWCFRVQWLQLKTYANGHGVEIMGDLPIFVAHGSADVWANTHLFDLDETGKCRFVAGVPPDYFSEDGQMWGNPLYRWERHGHDSYEWWINRYRASAELVDIVRIDHFQGFVTYWEIPAAETTGRKGQWRKAPGAEVFEGMIKALGPLRAVAEDLGSLQPEVHQLRNQFALPGMRILQYAFDGGDNLFLPHNLIRDCVVYTGTHDNNTTLGWWAELDERTRARAKRYLRCDGDEIHWGLMTAACASVAAIAIHPLQDILGLGVEARMNMPGTASGNWGWRFTPDQPTPAHAHRLAALTETYMRGGRREEVAVMPQGKT